MTYIQDVTGGDKEHAERIRREILENVESRRQEANSALSELFKFSGLIYSGGAIAILGFMARKQGEIPKLAVLSFAFFALCLLSFAVFLYLHYRLHSARSAYYAEVAHGFFTRQNTLQDVLNASTKLQSAWLYRLLFWVPFTLAALGFVCGAAAAILVADGSSSQPSNRPAADIVAPANRG